MSFRPHGTDRLVGQMLAMRAYLPLEGAAGGMPGATTDLEIHHARRPAEAGVDGGRRRGRARPARPSRSAAPAAAVWAIRSIGIPAAVAADVAARSARRRRGAADLRGGARRTGRPRRAETARRRSSLRRSRLRRAAPARRPFTGAVNDGPSLPLYPGIRHRGGIAYVEASGTPLAAAPDHWTDGCPVLESRTGRGPAS